MKEFLKKHYEELSKSIKKHNTKFFIVILIVLLLLAIIIPKPVYFAIVIIFYLMGTFLFFLLDTTKYYISMLSFRKGFYLVCFGLICLTLLYQLIDISNWKLLLQLAGVIIFLDLALFQTPGISKIWNAEFDKGEHTLRTLNENNKLVLNNSAKALAFHKVIANSTENYRNSAPLDWEEYKDILLSYFSNYTKQLNLRVYLIELEYDNENSAYISSNEPFEQMIGYHGVGSFSDEDRRDLVERLNSGEQVVIDSDLKDKIVLMPFFGEEYGFLLSVMGKGEIEANQIDAMYLINMAYIFEWIIND